MTIDKEYWISSQRSTINTEVLPDTVDFFSLLLICVKVFFGYDSDREVDVLDTWHLDVNWGVVRVKLLISWLWSK